MTGLRTGGMTAPIAVIAPVHPQVSGAAQFNTAMVTALAEMGPVMALSWSRLYPPLIHRRDARDLVSRPARVPDAEPLLDWADPRSWHEAVRRVRAAGCEAVVLPWVHPVMAPPYRYLLARAPDTALRVVICHNVEPHERVPLTRRLSGSVLRRSDLLVVHASHQRDELARLGVRRETIVEAFHPRFSAPDLCALPSDSAVAAERARQGDPDCSLLAFGAIRPYKGIDLALRALARVPREIRIRLVVAGVFWDGGEELRRLVHELRLQDRVELRDGFVSNEDAALLFSAADASLLPYRSATQSGVVQLSFAYGVPVIATAVGGLTEAVSDGEDGILCPGGDLDALSAAIARMASERAEFRRRVRRDAESHSFRRYGELLRAAIGRHRGRSFQGVLRREARGGIREEALT